MGTPYGPYGGASYPIKFDPEKKRQSAISDTANFPEMYLPIMKEDPDSLKTAGDGWNDYATYLDGLATFIRTHYNKLKEPDHTGKPKWTGDAATMFFAYVDGTLKSIDEWHGVATTNAKALHDLATKVKSVRDHMDKLWDDYNKEIQDARNQDNRSDWSFWNGEFLKDYNDYNEQQTRLDPIVKKYTLKALKEVLDPINNAYKDAFMASTFGGVFTGPSNAKVASTEDWKAAFGLQQPGGPGRGPQSPGAPPTPPGGRPQAPQQPPARPNPPRQTARPPIPPTPPSLPPAAPPTAPNVVPTPVPLPPAAPRQPTDLRRPAPPSPLLNRNPGAPPEAPNAPAGLNGVPPVLPGTGPRRGVPSGAPEAPGAPGGSPSGRPGAPDVPNSLQGRGGGAPPGGMPEVPPGSPMRNMPPQLPGRGGGGGGPGKSKPAQPASPGAEAPGVPPPGRGMPALPGRNSKKPPPVDEADPRAARAAGGGGGGGGYPPGPGRFGTPRSLQGLHNPDRRARPGSMESEEMPLRRLPTLDGRLTPAADVTAEELESTLQALRQGLSGRAAPGAAPEKAQPAEPETVPQLPLPKIDFLGDSELFTPEEAGPGVIQPQAEAEPVVREDPALRLAPGQRSLAGQ